MDIFSNKWYENAVSVERGPLVYALKIGEEWKEIKMTKTRWRMVTATPKFILPLPGTMACLKPATMSLGRLLQ